MPQKRSQKHLPASWLPFLSSAALCSARHLHTDYRLALRCCSVYLEFQAGMVRPSPRRRGGSGRPTAEKGCGISNSSEAAKTQGQTRLKETPSPSPSYCLFLPISHTHLCFSPIPLFTYKAKIMPGRDRNLLYLISAASPF